MDSAAPVDAIWAPSIVSMYNSNCSFLFELQAVDDVADDYVFGAQTGGLADPGTVARGGRRLALVTVATLI